MYPRSPSWGRAATCTADRYGTGMCVLLAAPAECPPGAVLCSETPPQCPPPPPSPLQCAAGQLEGAGHEDEFLCTTCSAVLRNTDVFGAGALEAANALKGAAQDAASSQKRLEQAAGSQGEWVSSSKVCGGRGGQEGSKLLPESRGGGARSCFTCLTFCFLNLPVCLGLRLTACSSS